MKAAVFTMIFFAVFMLLSWIIHNITEWYDPCFEVYYDVDGNKILVMWYNKHSNTGEEEKVIRDYKTWILKKAKKND